MDLGPARRSERDEVLDLLALWYQDRGFFARYNQNDPRFRDALCLVAREGGRIVSTVQIFDRTVNLGGEQVPMGGIGSVYTREDYRRRGIASTLMKLAVTSMDREGFEVSLLFADRIDFYARFGWRAVTRYFTALAGAENIVSAMHSVAELFDPARDFNDVAAIHRAYTARYESSVVRNESYWSGNLRYAGNPDEHFVVVRDQVRVLAYARAIRFHGIPMVMEYGYRSGAEDAIVALFKHLGSAAAGIALHERNETKRQAERILGPEPGGTAPSLLVTHSAHDPALEERLRVAGCFIIHHEDKFYMWRLIQADRFARRFGTAAEAAEAKLLSLAANARALFWTADRF